MSSLPNIDQSASGTECTNRRDSTPNMPPSSFHEHHTASESRLTRPATRYISHQPSEISETTMLGGFYDGGMFDDASSVTLQDEFPWHEVGINKYTQQIPSTVVPALLQGVSDLSASRSSLDGAHGKSREVNEDSSHSGDVPRLSTAQKGKWKAQKDDPVMRGSHRVRSPSPFYNFHHVSLFPSCLRLVGLVRTRIAVVC